MGQKLLRQLGLFSLLLASACVEKEPSSPLPEDLPIIKQFVLGEEPANIRYKVNGKFDGKIIYLGMDMDRDKAETGVPFEVTHYWKVIEPLPEWRVFVHIADPAGQQYLNADHHPVGGRYRTAWWKAGEIIKDVQQLTIPKSWVNINKAVIYTGLWRGNQRIKPEGPHDNESRLVAATIDVVGKVIPVTAAKSFRLKKPPKLDGKLDDEAWQGVPWTDYFVDTMKGEGSPAETRAKLGWDEKNLYIAFENDDLDIWSDFKNRDDHLWTQEAVEIMIDVDGDGKEYFEYQVNPHNVVFDAYLPTYRKNQNEWSGKMVSAVHVDGTLDNREDRDRGWNVEVAIPWTDIPAKALPAGKTSPPKVGDSWRINLYRVDRPLGKPQRAVALSAPLVGDFHKTNRFANVTFVEATERSTVAQAAQGAQAVTHTVSDSATAKPSPSGKTQAH